MKWYSKDDIYKFEYTKDLTSGNTTEDIFITVKCLKNVFEDIEIYIRIVQK